jgi:PAS domain S-box-containing protein
VANFVGGDNSSFQTIVELRQVQAWGIDSFVLPVGVPNPMLMIGQASIFFTMAFIASVVWTVMRGTDAAKKRRALVICGSVSIAIVGSVLMMWLLVLGKLPIPLAVGLTLVPMILVMGYILGGDVVRASIMARELQLSEQRLRASEERMQVAMSAADVGAWTWNLGNDSFWFSDIGSRLSGQPADTPVASEAVVAQVHPEDRAAFWAVRDEAVRGKSVFSVELRRMLPDGSLRWLTARGRAERQAEGMPLLLSGVLADITERREAEERLKRIVEGAPVGMLVCGPDGRVVIANHRAHQVFMHPTGAMTGLQLDQLLPTHALPGLVAPGADAQAEPGEAAQAHELTGRRGDGSDVAVEVAFTAMQINDASHVLVSVADVTARKRMELEHSQQREELAHLSRVSLLGELSGSLAHELNQPLTAVLSNAQAALRFLSRQPPNLAEVRESLAEIVENDKRASEVIRRLRAMLRKEPLDHQPLAANDVVHDVLKLMHSDLLNRRVAVTLELAGDLPVIRGDRVQLQQVVMNLVVNACDAMRETAGERAIHIRSRLDAGTSVELSVSDLGHGIAEGELERIFTPFVTTKSEGIGLGLAICRTIVHAHRGKLWASNNSGAGATFHFTLPVPVPPPAA